MQRRLHRTLSRYTFSQGGLDTLEQQWSDDDQHPAAAGALNGSSGSGLGGRSGSGLGSRPPASGSTQQLAELMEQQQAPANGNGVLAAAKAPP